MSDDSPILETESVTKKFGGLVAVDTVSVSIEQGEITGLIGPNGAGKSTLFNLMSGFLEPNNGAVTLKGEDVTELQPDKRAERGLIRTFQITRELSGMTVMNNMLLAAQENPGERILPLLTQPGTVRAYEDEQRERAEELLKYLELWELREEYAGNLSGGQRKLLELGRSLMCDPDVLLLDEPMAGVNPDLTDHLLDRITELRDEENRTFLIVEHDIETIMSISDSVIGMHNGEILVQGEPETVQQDEQLLEAYLGGEV
ncbi:ABC transporter ATP-binding protein [Halorubrum yunnanense]|uniref:Probable branched-chain amino acid transport ATP-binding protein LivG n=1 Tax=Halorubrum yunnanense TaxID=1526162 RepID=A0ABD5YAG6_9EURY|nr:ABC transporter ATP-binding protein [Halorubrum yunnanense]